METPPDPHRAARLVAPFHHPRSRRLLAAFLVSELGDGLLFVVVPLGVYAASGELVALASAFLGRLLLASVLAGLGGWAADRLDRRRLLLGSYVVRAALLLVMLLVPQDATVAFAAIGVLVGAAGSFDNPAAEASLRVAYGHDLQALAAARKTGRTLSALVGPALGGLLLGAGGVVAALLVNVAAFAVALVVLLPRRSVPGVDADEGAGTGLAPLPVGPQGTTGVPGVLVVAFVSTFAGSVLVGLCIVVAIPYLDGLPDAPRGAYGYAIAAYSLGALLGLAWAGTTHWGRWRLGTLLTVAHAAYGGVVVASVAAPDWALLAAAWLVWGILYGPEEVVADARVAARVPVVCLGRVYAWWAIAGKLGSAVAFGSVMALDGAPDRQVLLAVGATYLLLVPLLVAVTAVTVGRRGARVDP